MTARTHEDWLRDLVQAVSFVPDETLRQAAAMIAASEMVVTVGNGGSAALASHMAQAVAKPDYAAGGGRPVVCITDNVPTLTAHTNDGGWDAAMLESARPFLERFRVCVVAFSSSGRSRNVCEVVQLARRLGRDVVAFTGFEGEPLRSFATISVHVQSTDYEVVEPVHDALLHRVQYHLRQLTGR